MDLRDRPEDVAFRQEVRGFLDEHLVGEFAELGGRGGSGDETFGFEVRRRWEKILADGSWTCLGWPVEYGGRGASMTEQVIFNEEYARAAAPGRVNVMGEGLLGPTLIHYGTPAQKARFLPPIREGDELWCQGYSEPDAGSDLANVKTRAERDGDEWVVTGQKVWTSLAHQADWCFVVCRTDPESTRHKGLSYLLVPMDQPGDRGAADHAAHPDERVQRGVLRRCPHAGRQRRGRRRRRLAGRAGDAGLRARRGAPRPPARISPRARPDRGPGRRDRGRQDAVVRQQLAQAHIELTIMRYNTLRSLSGVDGPVAPPEASIAKLYWGSWHRRLGELAMRILGPAATVLPGRRCPRTAATDSAICSGPSSSHAQRRSTAGRTRSSATSSGSGCSVSRRSRKGRREHQPGRSLRSTAPARHRRGATASWTGRSSSSPRRPGRASAPPRPGAASRRARRSSSPTPTSGGWARRPSSWRPRRGSERVHAIVCDVRDEAPGRTRCTKVPSARFGRIDVAVHNAGLGGTVPLVEMTDEQWSTVLDITLTGTFRCTRAALTRMLPQKSGVDRQQRLGARVARPARPGPLRRGQGGRHGADAVRRRRGRARPGCGSTRCRPAWPSIPS